MKDAYRADGATHGGYGMPRGPLGGLPPWVDTPPAIGFCPLCGTNARKTCRVRGAFDCPNCMFVWTDKRVGEQTRSIDDYFSGGDDTDA